MKKLMIIPLAIMMGLFSSAIFAYGCNYYDAFGFYTPISAKFISVKSQIPIVSQDKNGFIIHGTCNGVHDGEITIKASMGDNTTCTTTIEDGQFYFEPEVKSTICTGNWKFGKLQNMIKPTKHTAITFGLEYKKTK